MTLTNTIRDNVSSVRFWLVVAHLVVTGLPVHDAIAAAMLRWTGRMGAALEADATRTYQRFAEEAAWTGGSDGSPGALAPRSAQPSDAIESRQAIPPNAVSDDPGARQPQSAGEAAASPPTAPSAAEPTPPHGATGAAGQGGA